MEKTLIASFQARMGWLRQRKRENKKNKKSFHCVPTRPGIENTKKIEKKIQKIKKQHYRFFSSQDRLGKAKKERK